MKLETEKSTLKGAYKIQILLVNNFTVKFFNRFIFGVVLMAQNLL